MTDLLTALRKQKITVVEVDGWRTRGKPMAADIVGSVNHHTGGAVHGAIPSLNVLINGRSDLPGPLCNVGLGRDNKAYLISAGKANHAGVGAWKGQTGNYKFFGLEWEHSGGPNEPIPNELVETAAKIHAAFAEVGTFNATMTCQHWEFALPPGRKVDFCKGRLDPGAFRAKVQHYIDNPPTTVKIYPYPGYALRKGMVNADVGHLKEMLIEGGFGPMKMDTVINRTTFGDGTEISVKALQKAAGLEQSGVVGPKTWNAAIYCAAH